MAAAGRKAVFGSLDVKCGNRCKAVMKTLSTGSYLMLAGISTTPIAMRTRDQIR